VVLLPTSRLSFARVVLSSPEEASGHWIPISLEPDGQLFLALRFAVFLFLSGMAIQFWYIRTRWLKDSREMPMRRLFSAVLSIVMSGTIVVVIAQCGVMMWETEMRHLALPVPFMLLVFVHGLKLLAAGFVPEIVEDTLL
jgi:TRAP-type C4-dicarboxylate transport system permease large subunit